MTSSPNSDVRPRGFGQDSDGVHGANAAPDDPQEAVHSLTRPQV
jgi:hypothetical protein